ncbi:hypothetical protein EVG20_g4365 [Dentipellis fragilis]|uniref:AAA+ ATPase domain-containing protein n=1 Tax=Dentipellis fragilis TaxID=205917 RepID=A0A4Y9YY93_9AGAM|nr:hypothetical protein EVG20_g4365 [Dentipellis fragilis]
MTATPAANDLLRLKKLLNDLRDQPVDSSAATDEIISPIYNYVMKVPARPADGVVHWFCEYADDLTVQAATFLLRLFAYNSERVDLWKQKMQSMMGACCACIRGLQEAKWNSRETYMGAFEPTTIASFMEAFDEWELKMVLDSLSRSHIVPGPPATPQQSRSLTDAPPAVVYHLVANIHVLRNSGIQSILQAYPPSNAISAWPSEPVPPGIFLLLLHQDQAIRQWARLHVARCRTAPMAMEKFVDTYPLVSDTMMHVVSLAGGNPTTSGGPTTAFPVQTFAFSQEPAVLWSGFVTALRMFPTEMLKPRQGTGFNLTHFVIGHLHDTGPQWMDILRSFCYLLKRLGSDLWKGDSQDYPQVVFDSIKDNPSYSERIQSLGPRDEKPWFLLWFLEYLRSIWSSPVFGDIMAKMVDFLCEELQHERFQATCPTVMVAAANLIREVINKSQTDETVVQRQAAVSTLDIHTDRFVAIAFSRAFRDPAWDNARVAVRGLITAALLKDVHEISHTVHQLCRVLAEKPTTVNVPSIRRQMWKKAFASVEANDSDGMAAIISVVARSAHQDVLTKKAFNSALQSASAGKAPSSVRPAFDEVNRSLNIFRDGFSDAVSKYANYNAASSVQDLLRRPGVVKDIMALMLCPVEDIQVAAQTLVGQAFDVDIRLDCFRALLKNLPDASLNGIFQFIEVFTHHAPSVPEACTLSKSLVRCLTDVIEVLCALPDGLLHDEEYLKPRSDGPGPGAEIPKFWTLMTQAITVIFMKTPSWSNYFQNEEMIVWMRDALIFGRDMLAQWRVFESAAVASSDVSAQGASKRKLSRVGKRMVNDLKPVLLELTRWLRLTDEELLHQSFALLQTLLECFRDTQIRPSEAVLTKLNKQVEDARAKGDKRQTRLDASRLAKLEDALTWFDDDIQIISDVIPTKKPVEEQKSVAGPSKKGLRPAAPGAIAKQTSLKGTTSRYFGSRSSAEDKKRLEAEAQLVPMPKFRKSEPSRVPVPAQPVKSIEKKRAVIAVSSSSEESSDNESGNEGLAGLVKLQKSPRIKKPTERRQVKVMDLPANAKKSMQERFNRRDDARRIAMRMRPDVSELHRILLSWPYDHTGSDPPWKGEKPQLLKVPDRFADMDHYRRVFQPLLLLECWAQIMQSKDEQPERFECKIMSRQFIDDWVDLEVNITSPLSKGWFLSETDVVLLRHPSGNKCILGKAQGFKSMPFGPQPVQASIRCFLGGTVDPGLQINTSWVLCKVFSLSTLHREFGALASMQYYDYAEMILHPNLAWKASVDESELQRTASIYNVNTPQALAIASVMQTDGFSLIQGPPGTGKTSTICGLVQAFLSSRRGPAASVQVGRSAPAEKLPSKKILLCAPSNAAIDEVAYRLKEGVSGSGRRSVVPKVVRVGAERSISASVKDISLDTLVDQKLQASDNGKQASRDSSSELSVLRADLDSVRRQKQEKQEELMSIHDNTAKTLALEEDIKKLNSRRVALTQQLDRLKDKQKSDNRSLDAIRRKFRAMVLSEADVICSTLSGSGHDVLEQLDFDMIIIDEAAQAIELNPQQLPPTVISLEATRFDYNQSLFVRLQKQRPDAVHLLSIQYRMHPDISQLPSRVFYHGRLQDGPNMAEKTKQPWHVSNRFGPYRFFNVYGGKETQKLHSISNLTEVQVAVTLFSRLRKEFSSVDFDYRIGIVSMYRAQLDELRRTFERTFGFEVADKVVFNTVDGFQGQEKDIIILSCVRAGPGLTKVGFLSDVRRMNVALTRARSSLFILGHAATLERSDENWKEIVADARSRSCFLDVDASYFTAPGTDTRAQLPPKPTRVMLPVPQAKPAPAIPVNLATPQNLKAAVSRKPPSDAPNLVQPANIERRPPSVAAPAFAPNNTSVAENQPPKPVAGQKRPPPADAGGSAEANDGPSKKPRPPAKRQKQAANLFIPKNAKKVNTSIHFLDYA